MITLQFDGFDLSYRSGAYYFFTRIIWKRLIKILQHKVHLVPNRMNNRKLTKFIRPTANNTEDSDLVLVISLTINLKN